MLLKSDFFFFFFQTFLCTSNTNYKCIHAEINAEMLVLPLLIEIYGKNFS